MLSSATIGKKEEPVEHQKCDPEQAQELLLPNRGHYRFS
jgi:hypothetical protein